MYPPILFCEIPLGKSMIYTSRLDPLAQSKYCIKPLEQCTCWIMIGNESFMDGLRWKWIKLKQIYILFMKYSILKWHCNTMKSWDKYCSTMASHLVRFFYPKGARTCGEKWRSNFLGACLFDLSELSCITSWRLPICGTITIVVASGTDFRKLKS